ncbi:uncharacterized protein LOC111705247 isoform X1 [Eurytemora carolleeae]|uniref:uncharacterized protein LOC111705247 isoform X1 n=1 Tax=Eurytemora carolleeae TaxID=1294199 RepID=UPI000C78DA34|nr:uncharacterized protein LOC111705247 isoform X1 [Eurytemora carolleeae]|eukprot:XP_023333504.1 uncharacterized protein LOC111705247 isoform X1 [Eurytemora affinis]
MMMKGYLERVNLTVNCLPFCSYYFLLNLGVGLVFRYMNLFARSIGLSMLDIGLILGLNTILSLPANPLAGYISDKIGYRLVLVFALIGNIAIALSMFLIPPYSSYAKVRIGLENDATPVWMFEYVNDTECLVEPELNITTLKCGDDVLPVNITIDTSLADVYQGYCNLTSKNYCSYELESFLVLNETVRECEVLNGESYVSGSYIIVFWCYFLLKTLYTFLINVMYNTSDALGSCIAKLEKGKYSSMVFFADIAMALAPLITGPLLDNVSRFETEYDCRTGEEVKNPDYLVTYLLSSAVLLLAVFNIYFIKPVVYKNEKKLTLRQELSWLWNYSAFIFFLLSISAGMLWGAIDTFFFVFLNETLGASLTLIGQIDSVTCVFSALLSLPIGFIQNKIANANMVAIAIIVKCIAMFLWSITTQSPPIIFFGYAFISTGQMQWVGTIGYMREIAPENLVGTAIGVISTCNFIIGKGIGGFLAGVLEEWLGVRVMFQIFSAGIGGVAVLYLILYNTVLKLSEQKNSNMKAEETGNRMSKQELEAKMESYLEEENVKTNSGQDNVGFEFSTSL